MANSKRTERGRNEIMAAATELILERGIEDFSLRETARRAGYSPGALYNHFKDKDALIASVAMSAVEQLGRFMSAVSENDPVPRLRGLAAGYLAFARENPQGYRLIFDCLSNPPKRWDEYVAVAHPFSAIVRACEAALASGDLVAAPGADASTMAYALWALVDGHVHLRQKHLAYVEADYEAMFELALDAMLDGMRRLK